MEPQENGQLVLAFAVGALVGAGAAFLLRSSAPEPALARRLLRRARRSGGHWRERAGRAARGAEHAGSALGRASREVLDQFRGEVGEIVGAAREEIAREIHAQLRGGRKAARRSRGRAGR